MAKDGREVAGHLGELGPGRARAIGEAARARVLAEHTYGQQAAQVEAVLERGEVRRRRPREARRPGPQHHLVLGQRPRHHLPRPAARVHPPRAPSDLPRARGALVRDQPRPAEPGVLTRRRLSLDELEWKYTPLVAGADAVVGSYVPDGVRVGEWVCATARGIKAFYDIDTPVTLAKLARCDFEYLAPHLIPCFDLYLSFTGGPTLRNLEEAYGAPLARALYCSVDERLYRPQALKPRWDLGYLGTYSDDRQPKLERLLDRAGAELGFQALRRRRPALPRGDRLAAQRRSDRLPTPPTRRASTPPSATP